MCEPSHSSVSPPNATHWRSRHWRPPCRARGAAAPRAPAPAPRCAPAPRWWRAGPPRLSRAPPRGAAGRPRAWPALRQPRGWPRPNPCPRARCPRQRRLCRASTRRLPWPLSLHLRMRRPSPQLSVGVRHLPRSCQSPFLCLSHREHLRTHRGTPSQMPQRAPRRVCACPFVSRFHTYLGPPRSSRSRKPRPTPGRAAGHSLRNVPMLSATRSGRCRCNSAPPNANYWCSKYCRRPRHLASLAPEEGLGHLQEWPVPLSLAVLRCASRPRRYPWRPAMVRPACRLRRAVPSRSPLLPTPLR
mmetsp:Transcript_122623/g.392502  ORF Transcript_122623/g.392502 Transcript_122623/m.392502 type:complete len:301 (+) Transcript_122623:428-1330(+)